MKNETYILKLNEAIIRGILVDRSAKLSHFAGVHSSVTYKFELIGETSENLAVSLVFKVSSDDSESDDKMWFDDKHSISDMLKICKRKRNRSYGYMKLSVDMMLNFIREHVKERNISGLPKKKPENIKLAFFGEIGKDLRCVIAFAKDGSVNLDLKVLDETANFSEGTYEDFRAVKISY
jgi:hypothetical protein